MATLVSSRGIEKVRTCPMGRRNYKSGGGAWTSMDPRMGGGPRPPLFIEEDEIFVAHQTDRDPPVSPSALRPAETRTLVPARSRLRDSRASCHRGNRVGIQDNVS